MKIVFMGTPDFAVGALEALIGAGHEILAVVTQPDKPKGRSKELLPPPVKQCALKYQIPVMQPRRIKTPEAVAELKRYPADIYVVVAFGQILSQEILEIPTYGSLNIHASLLPEYRGASPIQHVLIAGEKKTGVTIQQMDAGIDTGDILYQREIPIADTDDYETLHDKLMALGGESIVETLALLEQGKLTPEKQDDSRSSYAPLIDKGMGKLDLNKSAAELHRLIRGLTPWPGTFTVFRGRQLKIWKAEAVTLEDVAADAGDGAAAFGESMVPGQILKVDKDSITVAAGDGALRIYELQLEGKKRMTTHDFLLGVKLQAGEKLGE
ncbi:MAG: methionyl-tRNA formyltransferase [Eubacterium sp.]|nr:methionyl-tRNA formyltransferase [Eubacterium sp.]MCM1215317.1 methionyl-tRNA formyltransferase [Lachnospiraceae bacterium]MCM1240201.1 methionyl-tRNA formyltransferase [Lachnospiraceae bacterium]